MKGKLEEFDKEKGLFKSIYCGDCKQRKVCGKLDQSFCFLCQYQIELEKAKRYSNYQQVFRRKEQEQKERFWQLQLLKNYQGCKQCRSLITDAYSLYEENRLVCQPCRLAKEGGASGAISFSEQSKWYKKHWGINLTEWLENFPQLPVNAECAKKWLKDKEHLKNCQCLEVEVQEIYLLFVNSLKRYQKKLKECQCETSTKVRVDYLDSAGSGWTYCEKCEARIESAGHHGVIKNRNSPSFWGLNIKERILCGNCLANLAKKMPSIRRAEFSRYRKVGRL